MPPRDITVASTTDEQEEVERVANLPENGREEEKEEKKPVKKEEKKEEKKAPEAGDEEEEEETAEGEEEVEEEEEESEGEEEEGTAEGADEEEEGEEEKGEEGKKTGGKGKKGWSKRVGKLTKRNYRLEKDLADANEKLKKFETATTKPEEKKEPTKVVDVDKPKRASYKAGVEGDEEYLEAISDWKVKKALDDKAAADEKVRQDAYRKQEEDRQKVIFDSHNRRVSEARGKYDDFDDVVGSADILIPESVQLSIFEMDNGPDVSYYLAQHPEVCEKLVGMTPISAIMEAGALSSFLASKGALKKGSASGADGEEKLKPKMKTKAPAPIKTVGGGASGSKTHIPLDEMDFQQYKDARKKGLV